MAPSLDDLQEQNTFATMSWSTTGNEITIGYKYAEGWVYEEGKYEIVDEIMFVSIYKEIYPESINSGSIVVKENPDVFFCCQKILFQIHPLHMLITSTKMRIDLRPLCQTG